jgi:hypothetical protein
MKKRLIKLDYVQVYGNKYAYERKIERIQHDPIRYYEGVNERNDLRIKAVKLG